MGATRLPGRVVQDPADRSQPMRVAQVWRHPVKSFQGEPLHEAAVGLDGVHGDRAWGVRDEATGRILTGRREPRLLLASARLEGDEPALDLPTGASCRGTGPDTDAALSRWLDSAVTLVSAADAPPSRAEFFADATDDTSPALEWTMPAGRFVDALPLLVLTSASLAAGRALHPTGEWDPRRFRANVLVDVEGESWVEDEWCGRILRIGEVELDVRQACVRCTMVTRPQPGLQRDLDVYRALARHHDGTFGVWSTVRTPGTMRPGDEVTVVDG